MRLAPFLLILLLMLPAFAVVAYFGSYALDILPAHEGPTKKPIDFSYEVECSAGEPILYVHVFDKKRPIREVDATVALRKTGTSFYAYSEETRDGTAIFDGIEPGTYDISINPDRPTYKSLRERGAVSVESCQLFNETNGSNVTANETSEEKEEPSPGSIGGGGGAAATLSYCTATTEAFFYTPGEELAFTVTKDGQPYSGEAVLEGPMGRQIVEVVDGSFTFTADEEGYYSLDVPDCVMVKKDYILVTRPPQEEEERLYEVKGVRAYSGCVLTFFSEEPYSGVIVDDKGMRLTIPKTIGEYRVVLREGVYDLAVKGDVQVSLKCPEKRLFFERDLTMLLAAVALILALLYALYLFTAIEVVVDQHDGKQVVRVYRKLTKDPVKDLRVSILKGDDVIYEDLTDDKGEVVLPHLPPGSYKVKVGSQIKAVFSVQ